jgi:hypothetical protein
MQSRIARLLALFGDARVTSRLQMMDRDPIK